MLLVIGLLGWLEISHVPLNVYYVPSNLQIALHNPPIILESVQFVNCANQCHFTTWKFLMLADSNFIYYSVNIFLGRRLLVMVVSCNKYHHSIRDTLVETINSNKNKVWDSTLCVWKQHFKKISDWSSHLQISWAICDWQIGQPVCKLARLADWTEHLHHHHHHHSHHTQVWFLNLSLTSEVQRDLSCTRHSHFAFPGVWSAAQKTKNRM